MGANGILPRGYKSLLPSHLAQSLPHLLLPAGVLGPAVPASGGRGVLELWRHIPPSLGVEDPHIRWHCRGCGSMDKKEEIKVSCLQNDNGPGCPPEVKKLM